MSALAVIAKAPVAGRSKTRLCPPCTPAQAARLAAASLQDTLAAVASARVDRRLLVLDDPSGAFRAPSGFELLRQRGDGLAERLASAFADAGGPTLLIGMDTPQVTPALLEHGLALLHPRRAVLGPAPDGGYWAIGLAAPDARVFAGVPMSSDETCAVQRRRLAACGLAVDELPPLRDVDRIDDARAAAVAAPGGRFAAMLRGLALEPAAGAAA
ncbi:MAG TPA: TIGR04282 family arsenosugar biosynthesis glycosyltransferase [Conexibacter sp.]|nr:TIGR04282 family arsenosugar biosynthesis glycosyltransferase [Conexibacter sp.]